ncbi:MAG TPA: DUF4421 domain-containing protein [Cryomorphaceae bacterium]|nr:DUF4421 domain-containing protein [Cryomorphaceae bacterium]
MDKQWNGHINLLIPMILATIGFFSEGFAQDISGGYNKQNNKLDYDSIYIQTFPNHITGRVYLSQKYTDLEIEDEVEDVSIYYSPNTTLNLGVGFTVKSVSLNLAYGFSFLNPDEGRGKTRYLDLQSHIYTREWIVDIFGQFYSGLYLENTIELNPEYHEPFYRRSDLNEIIIGGSAFYVVNNREYSFRAGLIQNERQLKSAGSLLFGMESYLGKVSGDSTIVPYFSSAEAFGDARHAHTITFAKIGPSAGYAHTFVLDRRFFLMLSLSLNLSYGVHTSTNSDTQIAEEAIDIGAFGRFALGYNDQNWYLGLSTVNNNIAASSDDRRMFAQFGIGNVRLNFAKRILPGKKLKKIVAKIP